MHDSCINQFYAFWNAKRSNQLLTNNASRNHYSSSSLLTVKTLNTRGSFRYPDFAPSKRPIFMWHYSHPWTKQIEKSSLRCFLANSSRASKWFIFIGGRILGLTCLTRSRSTLHLVDLDTFSRTYMSGKILWNVLVKLQKMKSII